MALAACGERSDFDIDASLADIEDAITNGGLEICDTVEDDDGQANEAVESRQYVVAFDCDSDDTVQVVVDEFDDAEDRDGAARNFESQVRPRGYGVVWTYGPFTIFTFGERDDAVEEQLTDNLDDLGAK
ncbi:MAG: hypothetical protein ACRDWD_04730 [Acidimicrobiia bacterium]